MLGGSLFRVHRAERGDLGAASLGVISGTNMGKGDAAVRLALNAGRVPLRSGRHPAAGVPPKSGTCPAAKLMYAGNGARSVKSATMTPYCGLAGGVCRQGGAQWAPDERRIECAGDRRDGRPGQAGLSD